MIFNYLIKLLIILWSASFAQLVLAISLYCSPKDLSGWNTALKAELPSTCEEYRAKFPTNIGCLSFKFTYEASDEFANMNEITEYRVVKKTAYNYEFQSTNASGFDNDKLVSFEDTIKINRRKLTYTRGHGTSLKISKNEFKSHFLLESGQCIELPDELDPPRF